MFKTIADPYVGRMNLFRVISGTFRPDTTVFNTTKRKDERVGHLLTVAARPRSRPTRWWPATSGRWPSWPTLHRRHPHVQGRPGVLPAPVMPDPLLPIAIAPSPAATRGSPRAWPGPRPRT